MGGPASIIDLARKLTQEVLLPAAMDVESSRAIPASHLDLLAASGFYGMAGPREYGGLGLDNAGACQVLEIMAGGCLSTTFVLLQHHGAVRAVAQHADASVRERWLRPLCTGERRAGLALAGAMPGPPMLRARRVSGGYVFDGTSPWVTGWGHIDTLHAAARDPDDNVVWALLDADAEASLSVEPLDMVAVMASQTVHANFHNYFVPAERITSSMPLGEWQARDAAGLRSNGSLALGVAGRCCALIGPSSLDRQLIDAREALNTASAQAMPAARAAAAELAMRAASALVVAHGSRSILASSQAQRLAREAMFLLVFGTRPAIKEHLSRLLHP
ncbi:MAG TPA: acyl-CoA dehydrogenase family protein [Streptosporangiaceae bacterium]|nr:acyl-CoA dehydrogenase family protein [Streptosporangiaceae bacterium]